MRNLAKYPVAETEITGALERLACSIEDEGGVGDMRPLLLRTAMQIVITAGNMLHEINTRLDTKEPPIKYTTPWHVAIDLVKVCEWQER